MRVWTYWTPYMVKLQSKKPSIQAILEKGQDGLFTDNSLFYQDILNYALKTGKRKFKLREVGMWLLKHNLKLFHEYEVPKNHTPFRVRFENRKKYFETRIAELTEVGLLSKDTALSAKVEMQVPVYSLTGDGYFITWLLERIKARNIINESERKKAIDAANETLYDFIQVNFRQYDSYQVVSLSKEFEVYKEKGWLDTVFNIIEELLEKAPQIRTVFDAIDSVSRIETTDKQVHRTLHKFSLQALDNLDEQNRISRLLYIKSTLEDVILDQLPPKEWEDLRLKYLNEYSTVILYGKCHHCGWSDYVEVDTLKFINVHVNNRIHSICLRCMRQDLCVSTELPTGLLWEITPDQDTSHVVV
jgi:hypothetical protein